MEPSVALIEVQEGPKPDKAKINQATKQRCLPLQLRLLTEKAECDFASSHEGRLTMMHTHKSMLHERNLLKSCSAEE